MSRPPQERLAEILTAFRDREPAPVRWLGEPPVRAVLKAWKETPPRLTIPMTIGTVPMHAHNQWKYAWKFRDVDVPALARSAGLSSDAAAALLDRLEAGRYIYPDGTLSKAAEAALSSSTNPA
jgi:hypothetical protein